MRPLDALRKYFPTGTSEGDRVILPEVFAMPAQMTQIISAPTGNPRLLIGNKGVGKTAILDHIQRISEAEHIPALSLRPDDLDLHAVSKASDIGTLKRQMYQALVESIAVHIGKTKSGMLSGHAATLHKAAVQKGGKAPDLIEKALDILPAIARVVTGVNIEALAKKLSAGDSAVHSAVKASLNSSIGVFFLLFDDTDQIASPDEPARIWAFLLAIRKLAGEVPAMRAIATLRSEVWMRLSRDERGQRDQVDHFRPLVTDLRADPIYMSSILNRRLDAAYRELNHGKPQGWFNRQVDGPLDSFFTSGNVKLPSSVETRSWSAFLIKSARERPRDMIQFVGLLIEAANRAGREKINSADAETAMHSYSSERVNDLAVEYLVECPQMADLIRTFAGTKWEMSFEDIRKHLQTVSSRFSIQVRGVSMNSSDDLRLLAVLFEAGFISQHVPDKREAGLDRHITFAEDPHFIQKSRWNELQAHPWEIHPAFRTFLMDLAADKESRK